jgi:hypothetical protein
MMAEAVLHGGCARNLVGAERSRDRGCEDVSLARVWRMPKKRGRHAKILAQHFVWRMLEPVGDQEGIVFVEVAIIKDQKEFAAVRTESLNGVGECPLENTRDRRRPHRRRSCSLSHRRP